MRQCEGGDLLHDRLENTTAHAVRGTRGHPRPDPDQVQGDCGCDSEDHRRWLRDRRIDPVLAKHCNEHGSGLGVFRWVVELTLSWFRQWRRLRLRCERHADIHKAFRRIGWRTLRASL
jgi:hypothetical protein